MADTGWLCDSVAWDRIVAEGDAPLAFCNNRASMLRFTPYWWFVRPVSGLIRRRLLKRIRDAAHPGLDRLGTNR